MVKQRIHSENLPRRPLTLEELERLHGVVRPSAPSGLRRRSWPLLTLVFAFFALFGFALAALVIPVLHTAPALA